MKKSSLREKEQKHETNPENHPKNYQPTLTTIKGVLVASGSYGTKHTQKNLSIQNMDPQKTRKSRC